MLKFFIRNFLRLDDDEESKFKGCYLIKKLRIRF